MQTVVEETQVVTTGGANTNGSNSILRTSSGEYGGRRTPVPVVTTKQVSFLDETDGRSNLSALREISGERNTRGPLFSLSDALNDPFGLEERPVLTTPARVSLHATTQGRASLPSNTPVPVVLNSVSAPITIPGAKRFRIIDGNKVEVDINGKPLRPIAPPVPLIVAKERSVSPPMVRVSSGGRSSSPRMSAGAAYNSSGVNMARSTPPPQTPLPPIEEERGHQHRHSHHRHSHNRQSGDDSIVRNTDLPPLEVQMARSLSDKSILDQSFHGGRGTQVFINSENNYHPTKALFAERFEDAKNGLTRELNKVGGRIGFRDSQGRGAGEALRSSENSFEDDIKARSSSHHHHNHDHHHGHSHNHDHGYNQARQSQGGYYQQSYRQGQGTGFMHTYGNALSAKVNIMAGRYGLDANEGTVLLLAVVVMVIMLLIVLWSLFFR